MGELVAAAGVPHHPNFPALACEDSTFARELRRLYGEVARRLESSAPDVLVIVSSDHLNHYFTEVPTFGIGLADETIGPFDRPDSPTYRMSIDAQLAGRILKGSIESGFDVGRSHEFGLDHSFVVPYHFLAQNLDVDIVPIFLNGLVPPLPSAQRCLEMGRTIKDAVESGNDGRRVAVIASGSVSLDLGGIHEGPVGEHASFRYDGVPDGEWVDEVVQRLTANDLSTLTASVSAQRLARAGNIAGEFLNWLAMLGMIEARAPDFIERHGSLGNVFAVWAFAPPVGTATRRDAK